MYVQRNEMNKVVLISWAPLEGVHMEFLSADHPDIQEFYEYV